MWETQLQTTYKDYKMIETTEVEMKVRELTSNLTPPRLMQIEGTEAQSKSENWHSERWCRLTASTCLQAYKIGQKVATGDNNAAMSAKKIYCRENLET